MSKIQKRKIQEGGGLDKALSVMGTGLGTGASYLGNLLKPIGKGAGAFKDGFVDRAKKSWYDSIVEPGVELAEETPLGKLTKQVNDDDNKSMEQVLAKAYNSERPIGSKKSYVKEESVYETTEFWDLLYDEPCWINPATGTFDLSNAFSKLWCNWYITKDPAKLLGDITATPKISVDDGGLREEMAKLFPNDYTSYEGFHKMNKDIKAAVEKFKGDITKENVGVDAKADTVELAETLGLKKEVVDQYIIVENNLAENLLESTNIIDFVGNPKANSGDGNSLVSNKESCNYKKWWFCFFFKFLTGPVGLLILKIMPYLIKFFLLIGRTIIRFLYTFTAGFETKLPLGLGGSTGRKVFYLNKYGKEKVHTAFTKDLIYQYLGLVIPLGYLNYDWGQIYGNGQFGKFILSLTILSAGIIFMGGISIFVFLCVFIMYCAKTIAMFGDNITEKKKN